MTTTFSISADHKDADMFRELARRTRKTQKELFSEAVDLLKNEYSKERRDHGRVDE